MPAFSVIGPFLLIFICASYIAFIITALYLLFRHKVPSGGEMMRDKDLREALLSEVQRDISTISRDFQTDLQKLYQELRAGYLNDKEQYSQSLQSSLLDIQTQQSTVFSDYSTTLHNVSTQLSEKLQQTQLVFVGELRTVLHDRIDQLHKEYSSQMKGFIDSYQHDISDYKNTRIKQLEQQLESFGQRALFHLSKEVLHDDEKEALIIEALDKAKKEGLFNG